jgi:putative exosortase-associated protein (TIGR04073 family)
MKAQLLGVLLLALLLTPLAHADSDQAPSGHNPLRKLGRGFSNLLFGVVEVPNQYTKAVDLNGGAAGWTYGVPKGICRWFQREAVGLYEIVTFPIPAPRGYEPVMQPEWPNEDYEP